MASQFLTSVNYTAVVVSGAAYWIIGSLWFSKLFGNIWKSELEKHGVKINMPSKNEFIIKLVLTLLLNILIAFGTSFIIYIEASSTIALAIKLGLFLGVCFSAASLAIAYTWENRSLKLMLIDCGYPVVGITICSIILSLWK